MCQQLRWHFYVTSSYKNLKFSFSRLMPGFFNTALKIQIMFYNFTTFYITCAYICIFNQNNTGSQLQSMYRYVVYVFKQVLHGCNIFVYLYFKDTVLKIQPFYSFSTWLAH